jgi:pilus assembly protein CpaB
MRTGTVVSLGASAVLGLGALIVARVWLPQSGHGLQGKADAGATDTVPVVVASSDIPYGTKLDASKLAVERLPAADAPRGAFSQPAQILSETGGPPIVLTPISAREPVLPTKLSGGGARATVAAVISEGMRAYTVGISDVAGVGGHVLPGDRVDVVLTREAPKYDPKPGAQACQNCTAYISNVVLQDVRVLGMDLNADPSSTTAAVAHTATLEVTVQDAQKLSVAAKAGSLSLALRRTGNAEVAPVRTVAVSDLMGSGQSAPSGARLYAVARRRPAAAPAPILIRTHSVIVVHGDSSSSVVVPAERFGAGA